MQIVTPYTQWFDRMKEFGFIENVDYIGLSQKSEKPIGGRPSTDHALKLNMAKELAMLARSGKGKQAVTPRYQAVTAPLQCNVAAKKYLWQAAQARL